MLQHKDTLGYAHLNFSGVNVPGQQQQSNVDTSRAQAARNTMISIYSFPPQK